MNKVIIFGKNSVLTILKYKTRKVYNIYVLNQKIKQIVPKEYLSKVSLNTKIFNIKNNISHQGIAVEVSPLNTFELKDIGEKEKTIFIIDKIYDMRNLGSIMRTLVAFNFTSIVMNSNDFNQKNTSMLKTASGAIEFLKIYKVNNINMAIKILKKKGYYIFGFDLDSNQSIFNKKIYTEKNVFVFGSEDKGLKKLTKDSCDITVKIPINHKVNSLNISNALSAFCCYLSS